MALFGRDRLPARSTLSRFLSNLDQTAVEALRSLFLDDLLARPFVKDAQLDTGGLWDRQGNRFQVFDIDGTREAARQRALPKGEDLPPAFRRVDDVCAPGYTGRKRGEVVRTRTTVLHMQTYQWLGSFGNRGNGRYREELRRAKAVIERYLAAEPWQPSRTLLRVDGQYGTRTVLADRAGFCFVIRGKDYAVLKLPEVQRRLHLPADQQFSRPESDLVRTLYDCPDLPLGPDGSRLRVVVAIHPATGKKSRIGLARAGVVYELFFTSLPLSKWPFVLAELVRVTAPSGWLELVEMGTGFHRMGPAMQQLFTWGITLAQAKGIDGSQMVHLGDWLKQAGLVHLWTETKVLPVGTWGGRIGSLLAQDLLAGWTALRPLAQTELDIAPDAFNAALQALEEEWNRYHTTYEVYFACGQVPR